MTKLLAAASIVGLVLALVACGPRPANQASQGAEETAPPAAPPSPGSAPAGAPASEGAPVSEAAPTSSPPSPAAAPGGIVSGMIPLQIKSDQGQPVLGKADRFFDARFIPVF